MIRLLGGVRILQTLPTVLASLFFRWFAGPALRKKFKVTQSQFHNRARRGRHGAVGHPQSAEALGALRVKVTNR